MLRSTPSVVVRAVFAAAFVLVALVFTACGPSSDSGSSGSKQVEVGATLPESGCGSLPTPAVKDKDGVVADLGAGYQDDYASYYQPIVKSAWSDWKPSHAPPYDVGIQWGATNTAFQVAITKQLVKSLESSPLIGNVTLKTTGQATNVPQALQGYAALTRDEVDFLIVQPITDFAFVSPAAKAAKAGIPTIAAFGAVESPNVVNINANNYQQASIAGARTVLGIGKKGNVLQVHAIPGSAPDVSAFAAFDDVAKRCPDIKPVGNLVGAFDAAAAKSETLKYLATHPEQIDGVFEPAIMANGIMSAFEQTGRPMPIVADIGPTNGALGYWNDNLDTYQGVSIGFGAEAIANVIAATAVRMLDGQGVKLNVVTHSSALVTEDTIDDWIEPGTNLQTPGQAEGPAWMDDAYINGLFNNGSTPETK